MTSANTVSLTGSCMYRTAFRIGLYQLTLLTIWELDYIII